MAFLPKTRWEKRLFYFLFILLVFLAIEIVLGAKYSSYREDQFACFRWDSTTLWKLRPSFEGKAWNQPIRTNAQGFRGTKDDPVDSEHAYRIITLGDSRTFGFGVGNKETYSAVLEDHLREEGYDVEVVNAGVHGFSAVQCRAYLEELKRYNPQGIIFSPIYNDRRYLVVREPDTRDSFSTLAWARWIVDGLSWSNSFFAFLCEVSERKLKEIQNHPPPLDEVEVRVSEERFERELRETARFCAEQGIDLVFLKIYENPSAYGAVDEVIDLYERGEAGEAIALLESQDEVPQYAYTLGQYYLGLAYRSLGEVEKAERAFRNHKPVGSLLGESVLRAQSRYFALYEKVAQEFDLPLVDVRDALLKAEEKKAFETFFMDECHYTKEAHHAMGAALGQRFKGILAAR